MDVRVIVLNYNGERLLAECLPSVLEATLASKNRAKLTVIDNCSTDASLEVMRDHFPGVEVYRAPENRVLCSYNEYLARIEEPVAILLNNDIKVDKNFIDPLVAHFDEADVFMATSKCLSYSGDRYEGGRCKSMMKFGLFWSSSQFEGHEKGIGRTGFTMAAGFGAFDRGKFLALGGYDDLYLPGRLEDTDICFRAWQRGWKSLYEPASVLYHMGAASFNEKFGRSKTLEIGHRNSFLFLWKNISEPSFLLNHVLFIIPRLVVAALTGRLEIVKGFFKALPLLPETLKRRRRVRLEKPFFSDRQIFAMVE